MATSAVECFNCSSELEDSEGFRCVCEETSGSTEAAFQFYCYDCILFHTKKKHVIKDRKGNEIASCRVHSILSSLYCRTEKKLVCRKCPCQKNSHDLVSITSEAKNCRSKVFEFWTVLEGNEKDLKSRRDRAGDLLSDKQEKLKKFETFVHNTMLAIEKNIVKKGKESVGSEDEKVKQTKIETESCIERTLDFQQKMRSFLALSDGALVQKLDDNEEQIVSLIGEQVRLSNLISSSAPKYQEFDTTNFIQETADQFLTKIKLPLLQEVVSKDLTVQQNVEIENLDEIQNELKRSGVFTMSRSFYFSFGLLRKQLNAEVYDWQLIYFKEVPLRNNVESDTSGMSKYKVRLEKKLWYFMSTSIKSKVSLGYYCYPCWYFLVFENGWYCIYDTRTSTVKKNAEIEYAHALRPVKINNSHQVEWAWAYWDELEKVIRISGKDGLIIPCKQKPTVISVPNYSFRDTYAVFAVVNEDSDVLIVNPNVDEYLLVIPQSQHTLRRIDLVFLDKSSIQLYDLNSNREIVFNFNSDDLNSGCTIKAVGHWAKSNCAIVNLLYWGNCLFASYNVGTPENPEIKKALFFRS